MRSFLFGFLIVVFFMLAMAVSDQDLLTHYFVRKVENDKRSPTIQAISVLSEGNVQKDENAIQVDEHFVKHELSSDIKKSEVQSDSSLLNCAEVKNEKLLLDIDQENFFVVFTIPKSGTHLLKLALEELTNKKSLGPGDKLASISAINSKYKDPTAFVITHTIDEVLSYVHEMCPRNVKIILLLRDFRDIVLSAVNFIEKHNVNLDSFISRKEWNNLSQKNRIEFFIKISDIMEFEVAKKIVETFPNVYVCYFENLIGSKGGGNDYLLYQELSRLANFVNAPVDEGKLQQLVHSLHGSKRSYTFFKGEIGSWKTEFDEDLKDLFKQKLGQTLIDWGYEQDNNW